MFACSSYDVWPYNPYSSQKLGCEWLGKMKYLLVHVKLRKSLFHQFARFANKLGRVPFY